MKHVDSTEMTNANADTADSLESEHTRKRSRGDDSILDEMNTVIKQACNTTCTICLEQMLPENELAVMEGCPHVYHKVCVEMWMKRTRTCPICRVESSALYIRASPCVAGEEQVTRKDIPRPPPQGRAERFDFIMADGNRETLDFLLHISALANRLYMREDDPDTDTDAQPDATEGDNHNSTQTTEAYTPITRRLRTPGPRYSFNMPRFRRRLRIRRLGARPPSAGGPDSFVLLFYAPETAPAPAETGAPASS
jgi:hypothetical protein